MPNWVYNVIELYGDSEKIVDFIEQHIVDGLFDFNTVIPEPQTEEECPREYNFNHNRGRFSCNRDTLEHDGDEDWFNWYDWRIEHWGTKWNSGGKQYLDLDKIRDSELIESYNPICIHFRTAWSEPVPVMMKLLQMHYDMNISWEFYGSENMELGSAFVDEYDGRVYYNVYGLNGKFKEEHINILD